nr:MalE-TEV-SuMMV [Synthetic plasmid pTac-TEV-Su]
MKIEEGKLVIWINGDKGYYGLAEVGKKFEKDTGIKVTVEHPDKLEEKFPQVAATGDGPDIIFWAHDRFGGYAQSGLLAEITPDKAFQDKLYPFTWDAVRYNGKLIAYPIAVEALSLIYNKDLLPNPPKTWEEIPALDKELKAKGKSALMFNLQEPYFTWPLIAADGGYAFKYENGKYDIKDVGVDNAGAKAGLTFLVDLIKNKHMNADTDYSIAEAAFNKGETAMTINGPWAWSNIDTSKVNYGVTVLPTFKGQPSKPFVGVLSAGINAASPNKELAKEFLENYLLTDEGLEAVNKDKPLGAVALKSYEEELAKDPRIAATMENAQKGEIMPNIPQMSAFWYAVRTAVINAASGRQTVDEALKDAQTRITKGGSGENLYFQGGGSGEEKHLPYLFVQGESLFKGPRDYNPISSTICHLTNESDGHTTSLYGIGFGPFIITNKHLFRRNNGTLLVQSLHGVFKVKNTTTLQQHLIDGRDMIIIRMPKDFPPFPQKLKFREPQREERICLVTTNFQTKSMSSMVSDTSCTFPSSDGIFWKHWIQTKDGQCGSPLVSTRDGFIVGIHSASNFTNTNNYFTSVPKNFMELLTNQEAQQWVSGWRLNADSVLWGGHKVFMVKPEEPFQPVKEATQLMNGGSGEEIHLQGGSGETKRFLYLFVQGVSLSRGVRDYNAISSMVCRVTNDSGSSSTTMYGIGYGCYIITNKHLFRENNGRLLITSHHGEYICKNSASLKLSLVPGRDMLLIRLPKDCPPFPSKLKFREPTSEEKAVLVVTNFQEKHLSSMVSESSCVVQREDSPIWRHWISTKDGHCGAPIVSIRDGYIIGSHCGENPMTSNFFTSIPKDFQNLLNGKEANEWVSGWKYNIDAVCWGGLSVVNDAPSEPFITAKVVSALDTEGIKVQ